MIGLPLRRETIVLSIPAETVEKKLWGHIFPVHEGDSMPDKEEIVFLFNGWIKEREFKISRKVKSPENFLPLIKGNIEETSLGSLVFVRYSLFFSANFFLVFWSVVTLFLTFFFVVFYDVVLYAVISFLLGIGNYVVAIANFSIQVKKSSALLHEVLQ